MKEWMTLTEAAERWGIPAARIRKRLERHRFPAGEARKSKGTWLVTDEGMAAVWGDSAEEADEP